MKNYEVVEIPRWLMDEIEAYVDPIPVPLPLVLAVVPFSQQICAELVFNLPEMRTLEGKVLVARKPRCTCSLGNGVVEADRPHDPYCRLSETTPGANTSL